jgi:hypothetical protein
MKPKQYVKEFNLGVSAKFDRTKFCQQIMEDFIDALNTHPKVTVVFFKLELTKIKEKFDNIFRNTAVSFEDSEKFWKYVYAAKIIPIRNLYFKDWKDDVLKYKLQNDPDFERRYNAYLWAKEDEKYEQEERKRERFSWEQFYNNLLNKHIKFDTTKMHYMQVLGISNETELTKKTIISQYRIMSKIFHPDLSKTETSEDFISITKAKEALLSLVVDEL